MNTFSLTTFDEILRNKYWFERSFKEKDGYQFSILENGNGQLIANLLGISPENIDISVQESDTPGYQILKIHGKSEVVGNNFETNYVLRIKPVKALTPVLQNGLLILEMEWDKPAAPSVEIKKIATTLA